MNRNDTRWLGAATALALALALVASPIPGWAQGPQSGDAASGPDVDPGGVQRMYYELKPSVVYIWASAEATINIAGPYDSDGGVLDEVLDNPEDDRALLMGMKAVIAASGSGWIVTPDGYVVTNGHVVQLFHEENEQQLQAELLYAALESAGVFDEEVLRRGYGDAEHRELTEDTKIRIMQRLLPFAEIRLEKNLEVFTQNWRRYPAEVKEYSPPIYPFEGRVAAPGVTLATGKDVAILKIEGRDLPTAVIGNSESMRIGEAVHLAGYPMVTRSTVIGQLNPETQMEATFTQGIVSSVKMDVKGSSVLQYDAATSPGHSGGPLFNDRGEVIGMATLGANPGIYFAVPTSVVMEFIRSAGVTPSRGMFDRNWDEALDLYYRGMDEQDAGALNLAVGSFDQALRILPDLRDAIELRREAMATLDGLGGGGTGGGPFPWLIGAVILVGLGLLWVALRQRQQGAAAEAESVPVIDAVPEPLALAGEGNGALGVLTVRSGPLQGNRFPVPGGGLRIGRDSSACQVVLSEGTVSRQHALVTPSGSNSEIMVRNLSGTNPTYVNDRAVQETVLQSGDEIRIGSSVLQFDRS